MDAKNTLKHRGGSITMDDKTIEPIWAVLEEIPDMLAYWDKDLLCRFANRAYARWHGVQSSDLFDTSFRDLLGPELYRWCEPHIRAVLRGKAQQFERAVRASDGSTRYLMAHFLPHRVDGKVAGFVVQLSESVALPEAQRVLRRELQEAQRALRERSAPEPFSDIPRQEVVGQLAAGISHDVVNVLTTVTTALQVLKLGTEEHRSSELAEQCQYAVHQAGKLVRQLMDVSTVHRPVVERTSLPALLRECSAMFEASAGSRVEVRIDAEGEAFTPVEPSQLKMALLNLVINSRDAMPAGGRITMRVVRGSSEILADGSTGPDVVGVEVKDDGSGMSQHTLQMATRPFFTTKPKERGTGLGLSTVHQFAEAAGGRFVLESELGQGTTATLWLRRVP